MIKKCSIIKNPSRDQKAGSKEQPKVESCSNQSSKPNHTPRNDQNPCCCSINALFPFFGSVNLDLAVPVLKQI